MVSMSRKYWPYIRSRETWDGLKIDIWLFWYNITISCLLPLWPRFCENWLDGGWGVRLLSCIIWFDKLITSSCFSKTHNYCGFICASCLPTNARCCQWFQIHCMLILAMLDAHAACLVGFFFPLSASIIPNRKC